MNVDLRFVDAARNRIAVLAYEPRRSRNVSIVVGHGYSSSKHNLDLLCNFLASHGFAVYNLDFPGHKLGASGGTLRGVDDLIDAMASVVEHARDERSAPVFVAGHSMGAMTALLTAAHDPAMAGAVSIATGLGRIAALDTPGVKAVVDLRSSYVDGLTLSEVVAGVQARLETALDALAGRPQLYVAAERDAMVTPASVRALFARAHEPKQFETIASDHTFAGDNARSALIGWLNTLHPRAVA